MSCFFLEEISTIFHIYVLPLLVFQQIYTYQGMHIKKKKRNLLVHLEGLISQ